MEKRVSDIGSLYITQIGNPSVVELGDSERLAPLNYELAVQRQQAVYLESEFQFRDYSLYNRPLLQPIADEAVRMRFIPRGPSIRADRIEIFSINSSAIAHIGSSCSLTSESRIKHIRHLFQARPPAPATDRT